MANEQNCVNGFLCVAHRGAVTAAVRGNGLWSFFAFDRAGWSATKHSRQSGTASVHSSQCTVASSSEQS